MTRDQIMAVPCRACGARVGHACYVYTSRDRGGYVTREHADRRRDAQAKLDAEAQA